MIEDEHYALWLVPDRLMQNRFGALIEKLSKQYNTPSFQPHITLLGSIYGSEKDVIATTAELARSIPPLTLRLSSAAYQHDYYRCLFIGIEPADCIMQANQAARNAYGRHDTVEYMPHLSIMYGKLSVDEKEKILERHGRVYNMPLQVNAIDLFSVGNAVENWHCVERFSLTMQA